ncbi:unnamed protein product [Fusarium graminearum]|nr:unnamed protein product [Fusarium graminearum]CAG1995645.1 unnamed protein product [Fusarium graminearum]
MIPSLTVRSSYRDIIRYLQHGVELYHYGSKLQSEGQRYIVGSCKIHHNFVQSYTQVTLRLMRLHPVSSKIV